MRVFNLVSEVSGKKAANQFVIVDNGKYTFQSYNSIICVYDEVTGNLTIYKDWDYSKTTLKHFYSFLRNYTPYNVHSKQDLMQAVRDYKDKIEFNY